MQLDICAIIASRQLIPVGKISRFITRNFQLADIGRGDKNRRFTGYRVRTALDRNIIPSLADPCECPCDKTILAVAFQACHDRFVVVALHENVRKRVLRTDRCVARRRVHIQEPAIGIIHRDHHIGVQ